MITSGFYQYCSPVSAASCTYIFVIKLEGNVLFEPATPMFHLLIFGNVSLKTVVLLIGEISHPLESVLFLIG